MTDKITVDEVKRFAELSRIKITDEEAQKYSEQFEDIVPFIAQISQLEVSDDVVRNFKNMNTLREDVSEEKNNREDILNEFPDKTEDGYLKVKKILSN